MESEKKPKEIKVEIEVSCEVKKKKWNELTRKEKGVEVFSFIWGLTVLILLFLIAFIIPFTETINDLIVYSIVATVVVWLIATFYLMAYDETFSGNRGHYCDWES